MPMTVTPMAGSGEVHPSPFVGPINHTAPVRVLASGLTTAEVDQYGYIKPGVLLTRAGALPGAGAPLYGAVVEAQKIAATNSVADLAAAGTKTVIVAVAACALNRAILEDSLGRALTANELASFGVALHSPIALIY